MTDTNKEPKYCFPQKPRKCPVCKSKIVGTYAYGLQAFDEEQEKKIEEGRVIQQNIICYNIGKLCSPGAICRAMINKRISQISAPI